MPSIVHHYLPLTTFLTGSELERAIRAANPEIKGFWPKPGSEIMIPSYKENWAEKPVLISKTLRGARRLPDRYYGGQRQRT